MKRAVLSLTITAVLGGSLGANDLVTIKKDKVLRVGVLENYLPFSIKENDGSFRGFEIDLAKEISKKIFPNGDGKVEFVATRFTERILFLENNRVDMVLALFPVTEGSKTHVDFSSPYLTVNTAILSKKEDAITSLKDLEDKKIALQENTVAEDLLLQKKFDKNNFVYVKWYKDCYALVKDSNVTACVGDNIAVLGYPIIDPQTEVALKNIGAYTFISVGVLKGEKQLLELIDETLLELSKSGYFQKAYNETFEPFYKDSADRKYFLLDELYKALG